MLTKLCRAPRWCSQNVLQNTQTFYSTEFIPRRALLYVPGHDNRKIDKAFKLEVDCIVLDCEDGVALNKKSEARENITSILKSHKKTRTYDLGVRVNSMETEFYADDMKTILSSTDLPDTVLLPKVNGAEQIKKDMRTHIKQDSKINAIFYIESAKSVVNLVDICKTAEELGRHGRFEPAALVFGGDDFIADIGATKSDDYQEVSYARQKVVLVAKAFGLQAIDVVHIKFKELENLRILSEQGAKMGFTGKQVIHPDQVPVVQQAFLPNPKQVEWAQGLLQAFEEHQNKGQGAFVYKGSMIDMPTMKQAQNIVKLMGQK